MTLSQKKKNRPQNQNWAVHLAFFFFGRWAGLGSQENTEVVLPLPPTSTSLFFLYKKCRWRVVHFGICRKTQVGAPTSTSCPCLVFVWQMGGLTNLGYAGKHTGRSSTPPYLAFCFCGPIWNLQKNTRGGALPYLLPLFFIFFWQMGGFGI